MFDPISRSGRRYLCVAPPVVGGLVAPLCLQDCSNQQFRSNADQGVLPLLCRDNSRSCDVPCRLPRLWMLCVVLIPTFLLLKSLRVIHELLNSAY